MSSVDLPTAGLGPLLTVTFNTLSTVLLLVGYRAIKARRTRLHRRVMLGALGASAAFLAVYLGHHAVNGSTHYPIHDWTYVLYLAILIPHSILAAAIVPFILRGVWLAWHERFDRHARLMRWVWPTWLFVSLTGILVFLMLYVFPHWRPADAG